MVPAEGVVSHPSASDALSASRVDAFSIVIVAAFVCCAGSIGWFYYHTDDARQIVHGRKRHYLLDADADSNEESDSVHIAEIELTAESGNRLADQGDSKQETKQYIEDMRMNVLSTMR